MQWKVYKSTVEIKPHYNADSLDLALAGEYQFVTQKGLYQTGDSVIVIPEKSVLPPNLQSHWANYLKGPEKNRVGSVRLRGEISQGILLNSADAESILGKPLSSFTEDEDISSLLGITEYIAYIPPGMVGKQGNYSGYHHHHDCVQYGSYSDYLYDDEEVVVTEKVHGSQINYIYDVESGEEFVGTKGQLKKNIINIRDPLSPDFYWKAAENSKLLELAKKISSDYPAPLKTVQIIGEAIPCQKGYNYGAVEPSVIIFGITVSDGIGEVHNPYDNSLPGYIGAPVIYKGKYGAIKDSLRSLSEGKEQVSGKELHIREGVVVRPLVDRTSGKGTWLRLKVINPKYKESGEELS